MKIILCLNRDIHAALALNPLLPALKTHQIKIILSDGVGKSSNLAPEILELKKCEQGKMDELFAQIDAKTYDDSLLINLIHPKIITFLKALKIKNSQHHKNFLPSIKSPNFLTIKLQHITI